MLHCAAEGDPKPTIQWDRDSRMNNLNNSRFEVLGNGSLYIKEVYMGDEGKYGCTAGNSGGLKREEVQLNVKGKFALRPIAFSRRIMPYLGDTYGDMCIGRTTRSVFHSRRHVQIRHGFGSGRQRFYDDEDDHDHIERGRCLYGVGGGPNAVLSLPTPSQEAAVSPRTGRRYLSPPIAERNRFRLRAVVGETAKIIPCIHDRAEKLENGEVQEEQTELKETSSSKMNSTANKKKENRDSSHNKSDGADTAQSQSSNQSKKSKSNYDKIAVSRSNLKELKPLGRGEFGEVYSTKYQVDGDKESLVMVKSLINTKDEIALQEFKRHLDLLHKLNHENVVKLIGLCREEEPDYMILEYTDWGDLKQFLIASRKDNTSSPTHESKPPRAPQLSVAQILSLSNQAAKGLKHLADTRLVHKDIAARNCLIASNLTIKISLPCMTKEPYQQEYTKHRNQVIPLRWLPYEAVYEDEYSTKSDVYSFSCLVWEMFHQGELPFNKMNDESVLAALKAQTLAWKPHKAAPPSLQELQAQCWANDPRERPTFDEVVSKIGEIVVDSCL